MLFRSSEGSVYRKVLAGEEDERELESALSAYRSKVGATLRTLQRTQRPAFRQVVPKAKRRQYQGARAHLAHIPLSPDFIEVHGLEPFES